MFIQAINHLCLARTSCKDYSLNSIPWFPSISIINGLQINYITKSHFFNILSYDFTLKTQKQKNARNDTKSLQCVLKCFIQYTLNRNHYNYLLLEICIYYSLYTINNFIFNLFSLSTIFFIFKNIIL